MCPAGASGVFLSLKPLGGAGQAHLTHLTELMEIQGGRKTAKKLFFFLNEKLLFWVLFFLDFSRVSLRTSGDFLFSALSTWPFPFC